MDGISIGKYGLGFVLACMRKYFGESLWIPLICLAGMVISAVCLFAGGRSGEKDGAGRGERGEVGGPRTSAGPGRERRSANVGKAGKADRVLAMNWVLLLVFGLTIYNPFLVRVIVPKLGQTSVYYRMFWAYPFLPGAAYVLTKLVFLPRKRAMRAVLAVCIIAGLALVQPVTPSVRYSLQVPQNVYKVSGSVPVLCQAIHEDFERSTLYEKKKERAAGLDPLTRKGGMALALTLPRCVFPHPLEFEVRPYDPTISLTVDRNMRLYYEGNRSTGVAYKETGKAYRNRTIILNAMYGREPFCSPEEFRKAMRKTRTHYLVVENTMDAQDFLTTSGCTLIGDLAGYHIYSYGLTYKEAADRQP